MKVIDSEINRHRENSIKLKEIYLGNERLDYAKCKELQKQQNDEYKKMVFLQNLKKEMNKNG